MIYQYDQALQLPTVDLYDTQMMAMALNAAKDMYEKGEQRIKDFKKEYGDFMTPILADQDWYNQNVTGKINDRLNQIYARGGDPLRNAQDRAAIQQLINSIDVGSIAKLRSSAENAREFLKERAKLEAAGLYNPLYAKYDGPDMRTYSTLDSGVWDKMSPTRITDVATFGNPYFEGMKPNIHSESKNGVSYSVESITEDDLRNVANAHFNELVSTPQGQLMYKYYQDLADATGGNARDMFNQAIVDGQRRRIYQKDDYDDQWTKREQLKQGWAKINQEGAKLQIDRDRLEFEKSLYGNQNPDVPPIGAADQISLDQEKQYTSQKEEFIKQLGQQEQEARRKLTSTGQKKLISLYESDLKTLSNNSASTQDRVKAASRIKRIESNYGSAVSEWTNLYRQTADKARREEAWIKYNSSNADQLGKTQNENTLRRKAHNVFMRNNIISGNKIGGAIDDGVKKDMNHAIGIRTENGVNIGTVKQGTQFAPITEAEVTGTRTYRHNSIYNKINRLLQEKKYEVSESNMSGIQYGHGVAGSSNYDLIYHVGKFSYSDLKDLLGGYTNEQLKEFGIERAGTEENSDYIIPMVTSFSSGSQTWANINTETDSRLGGTSGAQKYRATRQATSVMKPIQ